MFDENGDGEVDQQEFKRVMNVLRCAFIFVNEYFMTSYSVSGETPMAQRSSSIPNSHEVDSTGLLSVFFGPDGKKKLKSSDFQKFVHSLHDSILELEFRSFDPLKSGTITAHDFALSIVCDFGFPCRK